MKKLVKKLFGNHTYIYALASYFYNWKKRYWQPKYYSDLNKLISIYASENNPVTFIQVGSNDGVSNDPLNPFINKYQWRGFCIEPIPENFEKLRSTYETNNNLKLLNIAIGKEGYMKLYSINSTKAKKLNVELPEWYNQLASFNKDLVVADINGKNKYEIIDELIVTTKSFDSLISEFQIKFISLLHIDTEGADWTILSSFPFNSFKPGVIIFEHNHLSLADYKTAIIFLKSIDYKLVKVNTDTFAYQNHNLFRTELKKAYRIARTDKNEL